MNTWEELLDQALKDLVNGNQPNKIALCKAYIKRITEELIGADENETPNTLSTRDGSVQSTSVNAIFRNELRAEQRAAINLKGTE